MVKKSTAKPQRTTPVKARRPVIAVRVPTSLHRKIKDAAKLSGRSLSDEMAYLLSMAFDWKQTLGEHAAWRATMREEQAAIEHSSLEVFLKGKNWKRVYGARFGQPNWISPDNHGLPASGFIDPETDPERTQQDRPRGVAGATQAEGSQS